MRDRGPLALGVVVVALAIASGFGIYLLALAIVLPAGWLILQRPQRGLLLLAALLPYDGLLNVAVDLPTPMPAWKEALLVGTLGAAMLQRRRPLAAPPPPPLPRWTATWLALVGLGLASSFLVGGTQGLFGAKVWFFWSLILVIQRLSPWDVRDRDRFVTILMVNGALTAAFGIVQQFLGPETLASLGWTYNTDIRTTGPFLRSFSTFDGGPFPFAYFTAIVIVVGLAVSLNDPRRSRSQWFLAALPILGIGLLSAFTRGAWVLCGVGIVYLTIARHRRLALLAPIALAAIVLVPTDVTASAFSSSSTIERTSAWEQALDSASRHPMGVGIGSAGGAQQRAAIAVNGADVVALDSDEFVEPDNQYLLTLYEFGPIGLALVVLLLLGLFTSAQEAAQGRGFDGALAAAAAGIVLGSMFASVFSTLFQIFPYDAYLWLIMASVHQGLLDRRVGAVAREAPEDDHGVPDTMLRFSSGGVARPPALSASGAVQRFRGAGRG